MSYNVFFILSMFAAILMAVMAYITYISRHESGAKSFSATLGGIAIYAFFYAFQVAATDLDSIITYFKLSYIGISLLPSAFLYFALCYTHSEYRHSKVIKAFIYLLPAVNLTLAVINPGNLYFSDIHSLKTSSHVAIQFNREILYWIYSAYIFGSITISIILMAKMYLLASTPHKTQIMMVMAGTLVPLVLYFFFLLELTPEGIDPHPFAFTITGIFIAIALSRHQFLILSPPARSLLFDTVPGPIIILDQLNRITDYNSAAREILGISDQHYGIPAQDFLYKWNELSNLLLTDKHVSQEIQLYFNGDVRYFVANISNLSDRRKNKMGSLMIFHDITKEKKSELHLRDTEKKLRTIIENAPAGVVYFNASGIIQIANENFKRIFGINQEKLTGYNLNQYPDPRVKEMIDLTFQGIRNRFDIRLFSNNSFSDLDLDIHIEVIKNDKGDIEGGLGLISDTTEMKKTQEQIENQNRQLKQVNHEKDRLLSIIAHDLRGPISAFTGLTDMMISEVDNISKEELKGMTHSIREASVALSNLLDNLLEWSVLQRHGAEIRKNAFSIHLLVEKIFQQLISTAAGKGIRLVNQTHPELYVFADEKMVGTVLRNLISNGIKFTHPGGEVNISAKLNGHDDVVVHVKDNGIGIPSDKLMTIFSLTQKYRTPGTVGEPSSGLGLVLCRELIRQNNGEIWVTSLQGKGSEFSFSIPVATVAGS